VQLAHEGVEVGGPGKALPPVTASSRSYSGTSQFQGSPRSAKARLKAMRWASSVSASDAVGVFGVGQRAVHVEDDGLDAHAPLLLGKRRIVHRRRMRKARGRDHEVQFRSKQ